MQSIISISRKQLEPYPPMLFWRWCHPKFKNPIVYVVKFLAKKWRILWQLFPPKANPIRMGRFLAMLGFTAHTQKMSFSLSHCYHSCTYEQSTVGPCFSVGVLLAFGVGQVFVVQNGPMHCQMFNILGPCWLNVSSILSHCKHQELKSLPPGSNTLSGRLVSPPLNATVYCNLRTHREKVPIPKRCLCCLAFLWALNGFSPFIFQAFVSVQL